MIDDEKIKEAIEDYIRYSSVEDEYPGTEGEAFRAGANWAINEFLKDLWHPASEKPNIKQGECYVACLVKFKSGIVGEYPYFKDLGWTCDDMSLRYFKRSIKEWLYIDDLFSKKGGNHD